ncbi:MAG TPA: hypothetical protein VKR61_05875 [Bryobacteraceae bacterium]|nr:hypothetical protein [Bryobacteraceae bacterium]
MPRVPLAADETDVMREQLDYLIDHVAVAGQCGCPECQRYLRVRSILLEIFDEPRPVKVQAISPPLARAA